MKDLALLATALALPYADNFLPDSVNNVTDTVVQTVAETILHADMSGDTTQQIINVSILLVLKFLPMIISKIFKRKKKGVENE